MPSPELTPELTPVEEHLAACLAAVQVLPPRAVPLMEALDRLLAHDLDSAISLPSFDNSSMDGYAVAMVDVASAAPEHPVVLPVADDVPAGRGDHLVLAPGTAIRIMTGAPVPDGTDAVVPVEWTDAGAAVVTITRAPQVGAHIRPTGDDVKAGERLLAAGTRLTPRHLGLLAATGHDTVVVHPRPRVAVISTGSELVPPGQPLGPGQIHDSNGYAIAAAITELGYVARRVGLVADDAGTFSSALAAELVDTDLVITTGGVSAGAYDTVKEVLRERGTVQFLKVAMQPGMPQGFGTVGDPAVPIFTLPGNPVSSMVSFEVFVRPVLRKMAAEPRLHRHRIEAMAAAGWSSPKGKRQFVRGRLERGDEGRLLVSPVGGHGSHLVADLAQATCLVDVPADVTDVQPGDVLSCLLLDRSRR